MLKERTVLIVDDDTAGVEVLSEYLRERGWRTLSAATLEEASTILATRFIDTVLLDVRLPDGDGYKLTKFVEWWSLAKTLSLHLISGIDEEQLRDLTDLCGAAGYFHKPFRLASLCRVLIEKGLRKDRSQEVQPCCA